VSDLLAIGDFIALDSRRRARSFVSELRSACLSLQTESGRYAIQPRWPGREVRRMPVGSYLVFYRIADNQVDILRVVHSARDLEDLNLP
jgi:toxin ParE1/3/4